MVKGKVLIIEGAPDTRNGILRQGFHKLLEQKLRGKMPKIVMGDGKKQAIDKFLNYLGDRIPNLLVDLDKEESEKEPDIKENNLSDKSDFVYYMIQEMEAWFLSQPEILDQYYSSELSKKIPKRPAKEIQKPAALLYSITQSTRRGKYHKFKHAVDLLQQLNATGLMRDFDDFNNLVKSLEK